MINYDKIFGTEIGVSIYESCEKLSDSKLVKYKFNTYSSIAYLLTAFYLYNNGINLFLINNIGVAISFLLGIASFFWWASKRENVQKIDIGLYSALILWMGVYAWCKLYSNRENEISIVFILIMIYFTYNVCIEKYKKKIITIFNILSFLFSVSILIYIAESSQIYNLYPAINFIIMGFNLKFADTFKVLNPEIIGSGTGWFHILTALGVALIWKYLQ